MKTKFEKNTVKHIKLIKSDPKDYLVIRYYGEEEKFFTYRKVSIISFLENKRLYVGQDVEEDNQIPLL